MRVVGIVLVVVALLAGGAFAVRRLSQERQAVEAARKETSAEKEELDVCRKRLARFYQAWKSYRSTHQGADPPTVEGLVAEFFHNDGSLLACPTALRARKEGRFIDQGSVTIGKRQYPQTYGIRWLTAGYPKLVQKRGDEAPLVTCGVHRESVFRAAYKTSPDFGGLGEGAIERLREAGAFVEVLAVRRNGRVEVLAPGDEN